MVGQWIDRTSLPSCTRSKSIYNFHHQLASSYLANVTICFWQTILFNSARLQGKALAYSMSDKLQWHRLQRVRQFNAAFLSLNLDSVATQFDCVLYVFHCIGLVVNLFANIIMYVAQVCRVGYEAMQMYNIDTSQKYYSLDTNYYFHGEYVCCRV